MLIGLHNPLRKSPAVVRADPFMRVAVFVAFVPLILQCAAIFAFVVPRLDVLHFLRLRYTAAQGVDWVDVWYAIFFFPVLGLAIFLVNVAVALRLGRHNRSLGHIVVLATAFIEAMLAISGIIAVLLNG